jgi:hypothetical protein
VKKSGFKPESKTFVNENCWVTKVVGDWVVRCKSSVMDFLQQSKIILQSFQNDSHFMSMLEEKKGNLF